MTNAKGYIAQKGKKKKINSETVEQDQWLEQLPPDSSPVLGCASFAQI